MENITIEAKDGCIWQAKVDPAVLIETACDEAIQVAVKYDVSVVFDFNGVQITASADDTPTQLAKIYQIQLLANGDLKVAEVKINMLIKELKADRLALKKIKEASGYFDETFKISKTALSRINKTLKECRPPVARLPFEEWKVEVDKIAIAEGHAPKENPLPSELAVWRKQYDANKSPRQAWNAVPNRSDNFTS